MELVDVKYGKIKFYLNSKDAMCKSMKKPKDLQVISTIKIIDDKVDNVMEFDIISEPLGRGLMDL